LKEPGFIIEWARKAGKLAFQEAEELHLENIVPYYILVILLVT
jgi:hypothetical protein